MQWIGMRTSKKARGKKYLFSIKAIVKSIIKNPFAFAGIYLQIRKANTKKFPYSLFYRIDEISNEVVIFGVIHNSRSEKNWKKRIDE